jgi:urea carboxylase-associated protein 2
MPIDEQTHNEAKANRQRYEELSAAAAEQSLTAFPPPTPRDTAPAEMAEIIGRATIPGGWYTSLTLKCRERLRIVNVDGTAAVSLLAWNADDPSERFNHADTIKVQWTAALHKGRLLFSDMGRVILSIVEDTCGAHDVLIGGSNAATNAARYGGGHRNTRDNFILAIAKHGLGQRDIPPCVTFFAPTYVAADGTLKWAADRRRAGDFVELRAEMDAIVALSNCPHPLDPAVKYEPGHIDIIRSRAAPISQDDLCRTATAEAIRGFDNTDATRT